MKKPGFVQILVIVWLPDKQKAWPKGFGPVVLNTMENVQGSIRILLVFLLASLRSRGRVSCLYADANQSNRKLPPTSWPSGCLPLYSLLLSCRMGYLSLMYKHFTAF